MATKWADDREIGEAPLALARDSRLPRARRIEILSDWAVALADRELADREDGIARSAHETRRDRELLSAINMALDELGAGGAARPRGPVAWLARLIGA